MGGEGWGWEGMGGVEMSGLVRVGVGMDEGWWEGEKVRGGGFWWVRR